MKPGYIFSAVFVMALLMAIGLPQLAAASPGAAGTAQTSNVKQQPAGGALAAAVLPAVEQAAKQPSVQLGIETQRGIEGVPAPSDPTAVAAAAAQAVNAGDGIPLTSVSQNTTELQSFINTVINNRADQVVGVFVPGRFALPILQQPADNMNYITPFDGALTQYAPPLDHGTISLLAHNFLAGRVFFDLQMGDEVTLVYGDGRIEGYRVSTIDQYQALSPLDPYSNFIDQADPYGAIQSFQQVYDRYYKAGNQVVFQTCIERYGDLSWGRIFVVAQPYE